MKNILNKFNISFLTYIFFLLCFITGFIKQSLLIFIIIIVHELGHIITSLLLKYKIIAITIYPFGGITKLDKPINSPIIHNFLISVSGVFIQLLLYIVFLILYNKGIISYYIYNLFLFYNIYIMIFNLLFMCPLDGFKIIECLIEKYIPYYYSIYILIFISLIFLAFFIMYNWIYDINNYLIIFFLIAELIKYYKNRKNKYRRFLIERWLRPFSYNKISYKDGTNLKVLKRDTYHYFKRGNKVYSEYYLLSKKFDNNKRF